MKFSNPRGSSEAISEKEKVLSRKAKRPISKLSKENKERYPWKQNVIRTNRPNLQALDRKAANRAVNRVIATNNRAAAAKSASAIVTNNRAVAANKVAVSKAANDRLCAFD